VRAVLRLTQLRCWVVPGRDSSSSAGSVRRVPSFHSSVSRKRLGYTWALFLHTSAGENPAGSVPGTQDAAVPAAGAACTHRQSVFHRHPVSTPCAGGVVPGFAINILPPIQQWAVPAQAGEAVCLPLDAGLFRSAVGPHSVPPMHPLQSPSSPSRQTASPASLRFAPAPWSLPDSQPPHKATTPIPRLRDWTATKANWGAQAPTTVRNRPSYHARRTAKGYKYISRSQRLPPLRLRILWGCILL
jgi:hypothetical protein